MDPFFEEYHWLYTALDYLLEKLDGDFELVYDHGDFSEVFHYLPEV